MRIESHAMNFLLCFFMLIACLNSFARTNVTNVIDDVVLTYGIEGDRAVLLRAALSESEFSDVRKNIVIPKTVADSNVRAVADDAFKSSHWLRSVTIQGSVTQIGRNAFANCSNLLSVVLVEDSKSLGLRRINSFAFWNCVSLEDINLENAIHLSMIDGSAFEGCKSLKHIELPERLYHFGDFAFRGCESLQSMALPVTATDVPGNAFLGCVRLREIKIAPEGNYLFENGILYDKTKSRLVRCFLGDQAESIKIDDGVTEILPSAFAGCRHLKSVILPASLKRIGEFAFCDSGLKEIVLPAGLENIGYAAFADTPIKLDGRWANVNEL